MDKQQNDLYPRFVERQLREAIEDTPVVVIHGPRQCGKSTLALMLSDSTHEYKYLTFDDDTVMTAAKLDPLGFCLRLPNKVIIDEVQRVPSIFTAIKYIVDQNRTPGRLILTGSSDAMSMPQVAESLAGRVEIIRLYPFAQAEFRKEQENNTLLYHIYHGSFATLTNKTYQRLGPKLSEMIVRGSFPSALQRHKERRVQRWYTEYTQALVQRDIHQLAEIRKAEAVPKLLEVCALHSAQVMNFSKLSALLSLSQTTLKDYLSLLKQLFLIDELPAYHNNLLKRLSKSPKLHLLDTGLACAIMGLNSEALELNRTYLGALVETWVFQELSKQASFLDERIKFSHYRTNTKVEVDIILESFKGIIGIEVKATASVNFSDFKGLAKLRDELGEKWFMGILFYDGEYILPSGEGLWAVPLSAL